VRFIYGMATLAPEVPTLARDRAFETLYRRYVKDVYHYALALLRNPADAEDVTQTTFMNAYRAFKRGEEPVKPQNWLIKIAHNVARSRYATTTRRVKEVPLEDHLDQLALPEEDKPDVEAVLTALGRLPLNQRAALVLRELEGRSYAEIADTLQVSVPAVETLIFRARRALRLKASAVRALGLVPLPSSLTQLLESGSGVAAGGTAVIGSGFVLKALVALIAGGALTGIVGGTQMRGAQAAASAPQASARVVPLSFALPTANVRHQRKLVVRRAIRDATAVDPVARADGVRSSGPAKHVEDTVSPTAAPAQRGEATPSASSGDPTTVATSPVTSAVTTVTSSAPALPVSVPQLPPAPTLPPPPPLPPLP
jgi:RNA polymerase sigma factor (sigma-70 family)